MRKMRINNPDERSRSEKFIKFRFPLNPGFERMAKQIGCEWLFVLSLFIMLIMNTLPLLWALLVAPLADYQIRNVTVLPIDSYPARVTLGGVTIAVDPYSTDEKSSTAFDVKNMNSRGYFPLHVIIRNASSDYLSLKTRNIVLLTGSGQQLYTTPATIVVEDVIKEGAAFATPKTKKTNNAAASANMGSPLADFAGKELINRMLEPNSVSDGFLFFFTNQAKRDLFAGSKLVIPELLNEGIKKPLGPFTIPVEVEVSPGQEK